MATKKQIHYVRQLKEAHKYKEALTLCEQLFKESYNDNTLLREYIHLLICTGQYEKAWLYAHKGEEDKVYRLKTELAIMFCNEEREALYNKYFKNTTNPQDYNLMYALMNVLCIPLPDGQSPNELDYKNRQLYRYKKNEALEHIIDTNNDRYENNKPYFNLYNINLRTLYDYVDDTINQDNVNFELNGSIYKYTIDFPYFGYESNNPEKKYIEVTSGISNNGILDIYPVLTPDRKVNKLLYDYRDCFKKK